MEPVGHATRGRLSALLYAMWDRNQAIGVQAAAHAVGREAAQCGAIEPTGLLAHDHVSVGVAPRAGTADSPRAVAANAHRHPARRVCGEVFAVLTLYDGSDNSANRLIVLVATIILLLAVAAVPLGALLRLATILTAITRAPLTLVVGPDEPPLAEPGKTDPVSGLGQRAQERAVTQAGQRYAVTPPVTGIWSPVPTGAQELLQDRACRGGEARHRCWDRD